MNTPENKGGRPPRFKKIRLRNSQEGAIASDWMTSSEMDLHLGIAAGKTAKKVGRGSGFYFDMKTRQFYQFEIENQDGSTTVLPTHKSC